MENKTEHCDTCIHYVYINRFITERKGCAVLSKEILHFDNPDVLYIKSPDLFYCNNYSSGKLKTKN